MHDASVGPNPTSERPVPNLGYGDQYAVCGEPQGGYWWELRDLHGCVILRSAQFDNWIEATLACGEHLRTYLAGDAVVFEFDLRLVEEWVNDLPRAA